MVKSPEGKFIATVKIGAKGQIVIPKEVRDMFSLECGDSLVLRADRGQGIAMQPASYIESFMKAFNSVKGEK